MSFGIIILILLCRYLAELCVVNGQVEKFVFVYPTMISSVRTNTPDAGLRERADAIVAFLHNAPKW